MTVLSLVDAIVAGLCEVYGTQLAEAGGCSEMFVISTFDKSANKIGHVDYSDRTSEDEVKLCF